MLNLKININIIFLLFLTIMFLLIITFLGIWVLFSGLEKIIVLNVLLLVMTYLLYRSYKNMRYVNLRKAILWIEGKNSDNQNPITTFFDTPGSYLFNIEKWQLHKKENLKKLSNVKFFMPSLNFNNADPLKIRYLFFLILTMSFILASKNQRLKTNILSMVNFEFKQNDVYKLDITAWATPPAYTNLGAREITVDEEKLMLPSGTMLNFKIYSTENKFYLNNKENKIPFKFLEKNNFEANYTLLENTELMIENKDKILREIRLVAIKDKTPKIKFLSNPKVLNEIALEFSSRAEDDYGIRKVYINLEKPKEFNHFQDESLYFDLPFKEQLNPRLVDSFFYRNLSNLIWAGYKSKIKLTVSDKLNQKSKAIYNITLPEKKFTNISAEKLILVRKNLALKNIDLNLAHKNILEILNNDQDKLNNPDIVGLRKKIIGQLNALKKQPNKLGHSLYKDIWNLAIMLEEGKRYIVKNSLEQVEQDLFDSINQRNLDEISSNVKKMQESIQNLLDLDNNYNEKNNPVINSGKELKNEIDQLTQELQDLLKTGSKKILNEKIQKLKQLTDSLKNPVKSKKSEEVKDAKKEEFINKLSELLNEQELVMEESFNKAADRGKFKQSSEGSGGKSPREKQDDLRNTLGNIMRDIGQSENEIPQELGRADRAMRQASKDLEGGRPDRASNAQGRAVEMIQRSVNKMNLEMKSSLGKNLQGEEKKNNLQNNANLDGKTDFEYQGTSLGGSMNISGETKVQRSKIIAEELYSRYNDSNREDIEKNYIKRLLDWY